MRPASQPGREWAVKAVVAALSVIAIYNALVQIVVTDRFTSQFPDPYQVMGLQARLRPVQERVPLTERVGYFSDVPSTEAAGQAAFFGAQYALAPRIVLREDAKTAGQATYWLGVFAQQGDFEAKGRERGLRLEQDLGGYVILYRKAAPER